MGTGLFHHVLCERYPIQRCLSVLIVWWVACFATLEFRKILTVFSEPPEEVELFGEYFSQDDEFVEADEVGSHQLGGFVPLPSIESSLFLEVVSLNVLQTSAEI